MWRHPPYYKYVGLDGKVVSVERFGFSAPGDIVFRELGMTVDKVVEAAKSIISEDCAGFTVKTIPYPERRGVSSQAPNGASRAVGTHYGPTRMHVPTRA